MRKSPHPGGGGEGVLCDMFIHRPLWARSFEDFVDIFGGSPQNWTIFRGHFNALQGYSMNGFK